MFLLWGWNNKWKREHRVKVSTFHRTPSDSSFTKETCISQNLQFKKKKGGGGRAFRKEKKKRKKKGGGGGNGQKLEHGIYTWQQAKQAWLLPDLPKAVKGKTPTKGCACHNKRPKIRRPFSIFPSVHKAQGRWYLWRLHRCTFVLVIFMEVSGIKSFKISQLLMLHA